MIQFSFVSMRYITVHNSEPMPVPAIYVCNEFTKLKHYSAINLVKVSPNCLCTEIHKMVKLNEIIYQTLI